MEIYLAWQHLNKNALLSELINLLSLLMCIALSTGWGVLTKLIMGSKALRSNCYANWVSKSNVWRSFGWEPFDGHNICLNTHGNLFAFNSE